MPVPTVTLQCATPLLSLAVHREPASTMVIDPTGWFAAPAATVTVSVMVWRPLEAFPTVAWVVSVGFALATVGVAVPGGATAIGLHRRRCAGTSLEERTKAAIDRTTNSWRRFVTTDRRHSADCQTSAGSGLAAEWGYLIVVKSRLAK